MIDLTPQQIKDNAPPDATHYIQKQTRSQYWRSMGNRWFIWIGGRWVVANKSIYLDYALSQIKPL